MTHTILCALACGAFMLPSSHAGDELPTGSSRAPIPAPSSPQKTLVTGGPSRGASLATVLWWDATPEYGGQAFNAFRQEMSDHIDAYGGGTVFDSTYVASEVPGAFAAHMATNSYDVIVFDTTGPNTFDAADRAAVTAFYTGHPNLLLDGILYIRSISFNATTDFPGINGSTGGFTVNEVSNLAQRGGGIMIGTDHDCCQAGANAVLTACVPGALFSGLTTPSLDGQFNGNDLLMDLEVVSAFDLFTHWATVPSEAETPVGTFADVNGNSIELFAQVEVADFVGGPRRPYISTSWDPGGGGPAFDCNNNGVLDSIDIANGTSLDRNRNGVPDECEEVSTGFCSPGVVNSTGLSGGIFATGSAAAVDEDLQLNAFNLPVGAAGLFFASPNQGLVIDPGPHVGTLCVLPPSAGRYNTHAFMSDAAGVGVIDVDPWVVNALPDRPILAGETWYFQCWYRDTNAIGHFTDACRVAFQ